MSEKWLGGRGTGTRPMVNPYGTIMIAEEEDQRELAPSRTRTPEQRAARERENARHAADTRVARIDKLEARITEQAAEIDDLHVANRHLAGRLDALERENAKLTNICDNLVALEVGILEKFDHLYAFLRRVLAAVPSAGKPTIQEQCAAVEWRPPTKEDEG